MDTWTVLIGIGIGRTGFGTIPSIPDPTLNKNKSTGFYTAWHTTYNNALFPTAPPPLPAFGARETLTPPNPPYCSCPPAAAETLERCRAEQGRSVGHLLKYVEGAGRTFHEHTLVRGGDRRGVRHGCGTSRRRGRRRPARVVGIRRP